MKVVFGEADKMFRLIAEALAPSADGESFLSSFFLTESDDPVGMLAALSVRKKVPKGIRVLHCSSPEDLKTMIRDADVLVVENAAITADHIENAPALKLIQMFGRETQNVDLDACARRNIVVRPLDRYTNRMVAEHIIMLMLALARGLGAARASIQQPSSLPPSGWAYNWPACKVVRGLAGRVIGLVGLGQVGALVAEYLRPFGATVLYTRRNRDLAAEARLGISYASLDELMARCDVLSLHVPGGPQTHKMISAELLSRAKPGMMLVNVARGSILDEDALIAALRSGKLGGAALDVFITEPLDPAHPLCHMRNVILTPHVAGGTRDDAWLERELGPVLESIVGALGPGRIT